MTSKNKDLKNYGFKDNMKNDRVLLRCLKRRMETKNNRQIIIERKQQQKIETFI